MHKLAGWVVIVELGLLLALTAVQVAMEIERSAELRHYAGVAPRKRNWEMISQHRQLVGRGTFEGRTVVESPGWVASRRFLAQRPDLVRDVRGLLSRLRVWDDLTGSQKRATADQLRDVWVRFADVLTEEYVSDTRETILATVAIMVAEAESPNPRTSTGKSASGP